MRSRPDLSTGRRPSLAAPVRWGGLFSASSAFNSIASTDWSDDATRWNTGQLTLAAELCGNRITVCHDRAANDVALVLTRFAGGGLPGSVMGPSTENTPRSASMSTGKNGRVGSCSSIV